MYTSRASPPPQNVKSPTWPYTTADPRRTIETSWGGMPFWRASFTLRLPHETGYPVLEGGDVNAILETVDESEQQALARAIYQLQQLQK